MKTDLKLISILIVGLVITASWKLIELILLPHTHPPHYSQARTQMKHLATGTAIYCADYDDSFPNTTAISGTRTLLLPYIKNPDLFEAIPEIINEPVFNFNAAGAKSTEPPLGHSTVYPLENTVIWYATTLGKSKGSAIRIAFDFSTKQIPLNELIESLNLQFDRTGATLAPPDYRADQDPQK